MPDLKARTGVETPFTDGSFGSPDNDVLLAENRVTLVQSAIWGRPRDPERFYLDDFQVQPDGFGLPERAICPPGTAGGVRPSRSGKAFVAVSAGEACAGCAERARCPVVERKRSGSSSWALRPKIGGERNVRCQARRCRGAGRNLRAAIESTVRSVKHPFGGGRVPVRGRFRVACMVIGSAAVTNVRRLHRFLQTRAANSFGFDKILRFVYHKTGQTTQPSGGLQWMTERSRLPC